MVARSLLLVAHRSRDPGAVGGAQPAVGGAVGGA